MKKKLKVMREKAILLFSLVVVLSLQVTGLHAQNMYPSLYPSIYYNMDTAVIKVEEEPNLNRKYTREEFARILDGTWDPDSALFARYLEEGTCAKVGDFILPLMVIKDKKMKAVVTEIIDKTIKDGYSCSPDSTVSRGIFFEIRIYKDFYSLTTRPLSMSIHVFSNYYLGNNFKYIKRDYPDSNIFCCYYEGILGVVSYSNETKPKLIKQYFSETEQYVTLHLYKKMIPILLIYSDSTYCDKYDVHSTNYGLYRHYKIGMKRLTEDYKTPGQFYIWCRTRFEHWRRPTYSSKGR